MTQIDVIRKGKILKLLLMFHLEFGPGECCSLVVCIAVFDGRFYIKPRVTLKFWNIKIHVYAFIYIYLV